MASAPTGALVGLTMTRLGTVWPPTKFRLEASGRGLSGGVTVRKLGSVGSVTVTLMTTDPTPLAGKPAVFVMRKKNALLAGSLPGGGAGLETRLSKRRAGVRPTNRPALVAFRSS